MIVDLTLAGALVVVGDMRPADRACIRAMTGQDPGEWFAVERYRTDGPAWMLLQHGEPWVIGGLNRPNAWTGILWLVARPGLALPSWRKLLRATRTVIARAGDPASPHYMHRIEAHVMADWPEARAFAQRLGLHLEHVRRGVGSAGEDVEVWVKVGPARRTR